MGESQWEREAELGLKDGKVGGEEVRARRKLQELYIH